jgi:bifunctional DNA-binding transcriptional regulator/antitoxin component of YhaV-PrlF toxin-antitoxin module
MSNTATAFKEDLDIMPLSKITTRHQVTIPQEIFEKLKLKVGEHVEMTENKGKIVMTPQQLVARAPAPKLSDKEQKLLPIARKKVRAIQKDLEHSTGLTLEEAEVAAKAGLIAWDQRWWWTEEWQEGEREVERDIKAGRGEVFETPEEFLKSLKAL